MSDPLRRSIGAAALERLQAAGRLPLEHRAGAVVSADDEYGRSQNVLVQAHKITWSMLDALVEMALYGSLLHKEIPHQRGRVCRWCQQAETMWHTALIDPLIRSRGTTATELHDEIRQAVRASGLDSKPPDLDRKSRRTQ